MNGYVHGLLLVEYKFPPKMVASALLAMYDKMAVEYEEKKRSSSKSISKNHSATTPVLLLRKEGNRQDFFVPGGVSPK